MCSRGQSPWWDVLGQSPQKWTTLFCEKMLFCHCFTMLAWLNESVQYEMEEKWIWMQKSGRASNSACTLGIKSGCVTALPSRLCRQWTYTNTYVFSSWTNNELFMTVDQCHQSEVFRQIVPNSWCSNMETVFTIAFCLRVWLCEFSIVDMVCFVEWCWWWRFRCILMFD